MSLYVHVTIRIYVMILFFAETLVVLFFPCWTSPISFAGKLVSLSCGTIVTSPLHINSILDVNGDMKGDGK